MEKINIKVKRNSIKHQELETRRSELRREGCRQWLWGKYRNQPRHTISLGWLEWCATHLPPDSWQMADVVVELTRRTQLADIRAQLEMVDV